MDQMELHRHLISVLDEQTRKLEQKIAQMGGASKVSDDIRFKLAIVRDSLRRVHAVQEQLEDGLTRDLAGILAYEVKAMSQRCDELKSSIQEQMPAVAAAPAAILN